MSRLAFAAAALAFLLPAGTVRAQQRVELAPFAGLQYGGSVIGVNGGEFSLGASLAYGATLDVPIAEAWYAELLYSRDETDLSGPGPGLDVKVERFMGGVVEEHDHGRTRFFGVGLMGATRLASNRGSAAEFTLALGLGLKHRLSDRFGIRAEARGFYMVTNSNSRLFCRGGCLFVFRSSGLLQGDVSAGFFMAF
jgi:hypothetical protein